MEVNPTYNIVLNTPPRTILHMPLILLMAQLNTSIPIINAKKCDT